MFLENLREQHFPSPTTTSTPTALQKRLFWSALFASDSNPKRCPIRTGHLLWVLIASRGQRGISCVSFFFFTFSCPASLAFSSHLSVPSPSGLRPGLCLDEVTDSCLWSRRTSFWDSLRSFSYSTRDDWTEESCKGTGSNIWNNVRKMELNMNYSFQSIS